MPLLLPRGESRLKLIFCFQRLPPSFCDYWQAVKRNFDLRSPNFTHSLGAPRTLHIPIEQQCHLLITTTDDGMLVPLTRASLHDQYGLFNSFARHFLILNKDNGKLDAKSILRGWYSLSHTTAIEYQKELQDMGSLNQAQRSLKEWVDEDTSTATTGVDDQKIFQKQTGFSVTPDAEQLIMNDGLESARLSSRTTNTTPSQVANRDEQVASKTIQDAGKACGVQKASTIVQCLESTGATEELRVDKKDASGKCDTIGDHPAIVAPEKRKASIL